MRPAAVVVAAIVVLAILLIVGTAGGRSPGGPNFSENSGAWPVGQYCEPGVTVIPRAAGPMAEIEGIAAAECSPGDSGGPDFTEISGVWPVGQYGRPTATDISWAANPVVEIEGVTEAECASACADGCSGYSYDGAASRCALWPGPAAPSTTDGAGTGYAGSLGQYSYGAKQGDVGGSCPEQAGRPCWQSAHIPGYDIFTGATLNSGSISGATYVATLANCAAECDAEPTCAGWALTGSQSTGSPDGITPGNGSGKCSLHAAEEGECLPLRAAAPAEPDWYAGIKAGYQVCSA
jgi:hypothetical protein